jgi:hypothetical protein
LVEAGHSDIGGGKVFLRAASNNEEAYAQANVHTNKSLFHFCLH